MEPIDFDSALSALALAKKLYDAGRLDIINACFCNMLCYDAYFHSIYEVISSIFSKQRNLCLDSDDIEIMVFEDDLISNYFILAGEYGRLHKLSHDQNPYVHMAQEAVINRLGHNSCVDVRLFAQTMTSWAARRSKIFVRQYIYCGCNAIEGIAHGLVELYSWFTEKCDELASLLKSEQAGTPRLGLKGESAGREAAA